MCLGMRQMAIYRLSIKHFFWSLFLLMTLFMVSCGSDDDNQITSRPPSPVSKTLFVYLPWSGDYSALTPFFIKNIRDIKTAIADGGLNNERVIVFLSTTSTKAKMFEIVPNGEECEERLLKEYTSPELTTSDGITSILNDVKSFAPASTYAMVIGGHGFGWITVDSYNANKQARRMPRTFEEQDMLPLTRFFGGTQTNHRTDITTLTNAISAAEMTMQFILFDMCYMSSVEVLYDLRHVAGHIIACPTEVMSDGMPYAKMGRLLLGEPDYASIVERFYTHYRESTEPYATIAVTDCRELDALAAVMKEINSRFTFDETLLDDLQTMDGESNTVFFDFGNYVDKLCTDAELLSRFRAQLERAVPYRKHTDYFPYAYGSSVYTKRIYSYSGITTSAPSKSRLTVDITDTNWHIDTH